jgi:hypothetical protein
MGSLDRHFDPDEQVVFRTRLHPMVFSGAIGFAAFAIGVAVLVIVRNPLAPDTIRTLLGTALALAVAGFVAPFLRWRLGELAVTSRRVLVCQGLLTGHTVEFPHGEEAVHVSQTLGGRLLGYGTVHIGEFAFPRVAQAVTLQGAVRRAASPSVRARAR